MSAFMVSNDHINAILAAAHDHGRSHHEPFSYHWDDRRYSIAGDEQRMGAVLAYENRRSLTARYGDDANADHYDPTTYWGATYLPGRRPTLVEAFKIIACYRYQACEAGDFDQTEAGILINALERRMISNLPHYSDAPWEWKPTTDLPPGKEYDAARASRAWLAEHAAGRAPMA